ncbi:MAG: alpha/beta fold hydrolase [Actinobacteria bacterium]|nr:alpha/beta fold hydrolase [Actinomycetota bacterium]
MRKDSLEEEKPSFLKAALLLPVLALLLPLVVTLALIVYVAVRYRGASPTAAIPVGGGGEKRAGVKTMSEVMEKIRAIPFKPRISHQFATAALALLDTIPMLLNMSRTTAGVIYPYPGVFEPVMLQSQDGTPICGLLATQPGAGQRPAIIFVHGLFGSKNSFTTQALALKAYYDWGFHVFALDLRNFGDSSRFSEAPTCWGYRESDDILAAAEYLESIDQVSTVALCGGSMGAASALLAAGRSRLDGPLSGGVIALNGYADAERIVGYISSVSRPWVERSIIWFFFRLLLLLKTTLEGPRPFTDFKEYTREVSGQYYEISDIDLYRKASPVNFVGEIEVPCLVLHAVDDLIVPVGEAEELQTATRDNPVVEVMIMPGGGHVLYAATDPGWFYKVLETFFTYWGEYELGPHSSTEGFDSIDLYGNPDN